MALGIVKGLNNDGVDKNYPGYIVKLGEMTVNNCISLGYIPITVSWKISYAGNGKQTTWIKNSTLSFSGYPNIEIASINTYACAIDFYGSGNYSVNGSMETIHTDLEVCCKGNLQYCKNFTGIDGGENLVVIKWLIPEDNILSEERLWLYRDGKVNETVGLVLSKDWHQSIIEFKPEFIYSENYESRTNSITNKNELIQGYQTIFVEFERVSGAGSARVSLVSGNVSSVQQAGTYNKKIILGIPLTAENGFKINSYSSADVKQVIKIYKIWLE